MSFIPIPIQPDSGGGGSSGGGDPQADRTKQPVEASALSPEGDAFTTNTLNAAWTNRNAVPTFPYRSPGMAIAPVARGQITRPAPAASQYEVVAVFDYLAGNSAAQSSGVLGQWGVAILDVNGSGVSAGIHTADPARLWLHQITAYQYVGVYGSGLDPGTLKIDRITLALHKNGNNYRMRSSNDGGTTWTAYTAASTVAFTPTQIGFGRWHTGGSALDNQVTIRYFNVFTPTFV